MLSWQRLRERKLFHWAAAYLAAGWLTLQVIDVVGDKFGWPTFIFRIVTVLLVIGFLITLVIAWYHGERGEQRVSGIELALLTVLIVLAGAALTLVDRNSEKPETASPPTAPAVAPPDQSSVAVLPFLNMSGDAANEYFSDGITEEILNALARVPGLRVAARTSSFAFKDKNVPVDEIGTRLGVASVLEGSVRKAGNQLRITAQLVNARDGYHLWSETYDRQLEDIFAVQEDIAKAIVAVLKVKLGADSAAALAAHGTADVEAYSLYLQGRYQQARFSEVDQSRARELYQQALAHDPTYAPPHVGIALAWLYLADDWLAPKEAIPHAMAEVKKALELDERLSSAHSMQSILAFHYDWDYSAAERHIRKALELNPNDAEARGNLAYILSRDRPREAMIEGERSRVLDPVSPSASEWLARIYLNMRQYDRTIAEARRALELDARWTLAYLWLADAHVAKGNVDEALRTYEQGLTIDPKLVRLRAGRARALAQLGRREEAERVARELEAEAQLRYVRAEEIAGVFAALGNKDRAFELLERAYQDRSAGIADIWGRPMYDSLRTDPRFDKLLGRVYGQ